MCVLTMLATGCLAAPEDAAEEGTTKVELQAMMDDVPWHDPVGRPLPGLERKLQKTPFWEHPEYGEDDRHRGLFLSRCYQYDVKVFDPARNKDISVPVTVCN